MWRDVFSYVVDPEVYLDESNIRGLLPDLGELPSDSIGASDIEARLATLRRSNEAMTAAWTDDLTSLDETEREEVCRLLLEQTAPLAAASGATLQGLSAPSVFEDSAHLRLMALLADDVGVGEAERWRFDGFRDIARDHGVTSVTGSPRELSGRRGIREGAFSLPALIYAMGRRSDVFDRELIGIDLAWRASGLLPVWRAMSHDDPRWCHLDMSRGRGAALGESVDLACLATDIVLEIVGDRKSGERIVSGIALFEKLIDEWNGLMSLIVDAMRDPRLAMAILVQDRARQARAYHASFRLEGRTLSEWFAEAQVDPMPLVDALGRSKLVCPNDPKRSMLVDDLLREGGAMFRIFSEADVIIMNRWIASLVDAAEREHSPWSLPDPVCLRRDYREVRGGDLEQGEWPACVRAAYHLLQGRALPPRSREFARAYCAFWLDRSRVSVDASERSLPKSWRPGRLRDWLLSSHDAQADAFGAATDAAMPGREAVVDQTIQLAPLTLIDGAWLQGFTEVSLASSRVGAPLFETFWDELGNGEWRINHPKIYRDVLAAMDVDLPPTGSRAFAEDRRLHDESFRLPVYWLCLGKFPNSFRPEILGMNLAMELSGVGGTYRSAHVFLKHHGYPTTFVDIHNTIDNVSTGHSAWAADAIDAYVQATQDVVPVDQSWSRIRTGYESLAPIADRPDTLDFFSQPTRDAVALGALTPLLHRPLLAHPSERSDEAA